VLTDLYSSRQSLITASLSRLTNLVDLYQYLGGGQIEHSDDQEHAPDAPLYSAPAVAQTAGAC
jgi:outer membrane protein, multidrug efflux system